MSMAIAFARSVRIQVADGVTLVCRRPTTVRLERFLSDRFVVKRNKRINNLIPARTAFIKEHLVNIEGAQYEDAAGNMRPLTAEATLTVEDKSMIGAVLGVEVKDWRDIIPSHWLSTAAAWFEEQQLEDEDPKD